jgi:hypothetical protein
VNRFFFNHLLWRIIRSVKQSDRWTLRSLSSGFSARANPIPLTFFFEYEQVDVFVLLAAGRPLHLRPYYKPIHNNLYYSSIQIEETDANFITNLLSPPIRKEHMTLDENIFEKELDRRKQTKIEELVLNFLREKRKTNGKGYTIEKVAKGTGLDTTSVNFVLKTSLLYKKWVEWVEHKDVDYFRATSTS